MFRPIYIHLVTLSLLNSSLADALQWRRKRRRRRRGACPAKVSTRIPCWRWRRLSELGRCAPSLFSGAPAGASTPTTAGPAPPCSPGASCCLLYDDRKIRLIESNAKRRYIKKLTCKEALRQVFFLSEAPSSLLWHLIPPLTHCLPVYCILNYTRMKEGGGGGWESKPERRLCRRQ